MPATNSKIVPTLETLYSALAKFWLEAYIWLLNLRISATVSTATSHLNQCYCFFSGSHHVRSSRPTLCNSGDCKPLWYGVVQRRCAVDRDDLRQQSACDEESSTRGVRGGNPPNETQGRGWRRPVTHHAGNKRYQHARGLDSNPGLGLYNLGLWNNLRENALFAITSTNGWTSYNKRQK